jgi:Yip1 domain
MEPMLPTPETGPGAAAPPPAGSLAGRLLNVFAAPGDVFGEVKTAGIANANWLLPAILLVLISWVSAGLIFSQPAIRQQIVDLADKAIDQQVEKGHLPSAQAEKSRPFAEKAARVTSVISAVAGAPLVAFASPFWWGLIFWLGSKILKGNFSYMKAVETAGLANMILVLDVVVRTLLILVTGNLFASPSLALAVKDFDPQNTLHGLCALVNVMLFWVLLVRSIGLARLSGVSIAKAALWVFGIWAAYTGMLIGLGVALRAIFAH